MSSHRILSAPGRRVRHAPVVVVSGLPRSGTSMAMKMLAAGGLPLLSDGRRQADEDNPEGYFELEDVKTLSSGTPPEWLDLAAGRAVKVISHHLQFLPRDREYRVIFMRRRMGEILASQAAMLRRRDPKRNDDPGTLSLAYRDHLVHVRTVLELRPEFTVLELWYHEVIAEPLRAARRVASFLGLQLDVEAMARAVTPTLYRNRLESEGCS